MVSKLDKRAAFKTPTVTVSASGGHTNSFTTFATVWAEFKTEEATLTDGDMSAMEVSGKVTIRNSSQIGNLTKDTRITIDGVNYSITGLTSDDYWVYIKVKGVKNGI